MLTNQHDTTQEPNAHDTGLIMITLCRLITLASAIWIIATGAQYLSTHGLESLIMLGQVLMALLFLIITLAVQSLRAAIIPTLTSVLNALTY